MGWETPVPGSEGTKSSLFHVVTSVCYGAAMNGALLNLAILKITESSWDELSSLTEKADVNRSYLFSGKLCQINPVGFIKSKKK